MPEQQFIMGHPARWPTAERPLLGLTLLVVEDSRFASDAIRLMALHSGARLRRADCLASAHRHLAVYRPTVVLVDLGLPDGSGLDLISELNAAEARVPVLLATSGDDHAESDAMAAGADGFLPKPLASVGVFQEAILSRLKNQGGLPRLRSVNNMDVSPDPVALRDDLVHVAELLEKPATENTIAYVSQFLYSLAVSGSDEELMTASTDLAPPSPPNSETLKRIQSMIGARLMDRAAI